MNDSNFKSKFWGVIIILIMLLTLYGMYCVHQYLIDNDTSRPLTEEEREYIEDEYPSSVPGRYQ